MLARKTTDVPDVFSYVYLQCQSTTQSVRVLWPSLTQHDEIEPTVNIRTINLGL